MSRRLSLVTHLEKAQEWHPLPVVAKPLPLPVPHRPQTLAVMPLSLDQSVQIASFLPFIQTQRAWRNRKRGGAKLRIGEILAVVGEILLVRFSLFPRLLYKLDMEASEGQALVPTKNYNSDGLFLTQNI